MHDIFDMDYGSHKCLTCMLLFLFLQLCLKSRSSDWMACMCAVDFDVFMCLLVVVVGGRSTFEIARSLVLSHRLLTFGITLVC